MITYEVSFEKDLDGIVKIKALGQLGKDASKEEYEIANKFTMFLDKFMKDIYKDKITTEEGGIGGMYHGFKRN